MIKLKKHLGVILEPSSKEDFDSKASTFGSIFYEDGTYYFYYSGSSDIERKRASIGVATSSDGVNFTKSHENPLISVGLQTVTPVVFKVKDTYWMVFAFKPNKEQGRRLGLAFAEDPLGPWKYVKELIRPTYDWEGNDIDIGPSVVKLNEEEYLIYYSNASNKGKIYRLLRFISGSRFLRRRISILRLKILSKDEIRVKRWERNPLSHLNGRKGTWNESLFCPGYFRLDDRHYLLPAASMYSVGFPYKQYIGIVEAFSPFFEKIAQKRILINGPLEKKKIMPDIKSEIGLDTPSPLLREDELWLYYAAVDRANQIWKTALSIFSLKD